MTRTFDNFDSGPTAAQRTVRSTWGERAIVLGGFAIAALHTAVAAALDTGMETVGAAWTIAIAWTVLSSLALALRRGIRRRDGGTPRTGRTGRDWSAFRRYRLPDNGELIDYATGTGAWLDIPIAEEHERLMRGD